MAAIVFTYKSKEYRFPCEGLNDHGAIIDVDMYDKENADLRKQLAEAKTAAKIQADILERCRNASMVLAKDFAAKDHHIADLPVV